MSIESRWGSRYDFIVDLAVISPANEAAHFILRNVGEIDRYQKFEETEHGATPGRLYSASLRCTVCLGYTCHSPAKESKGYPICRLCVMVCCAVCANQYVVSSVIHGNLLVVNLKKLKIPLQVC
jgi:hypothetical protein